MHGYYVPLLDLFVAKGVCKSVGPPKYMAEKHPSLEVCMGVYLLAFALYRAQGLQALQ